MTQEQKTTPKKLHHVWMEPIEDFFKRIDLLGGWPCDKGFVSFFHNDYRECTFDDNYIRNEWHTTIATADDYYLWKLSDAAKCKLREEIKQEMIKKISRRDF